MRNKIQTILIGIGLLWGPILANSSTINTINVGSSANDGTGDTLRAAFQKVNSNDAALNADKVENSNGSASGLTLSGTTTIGGTLDVSSATTLTGLDSSDETAETVTNGQPSLWFDGSADYVSVADNANLSFTDGTDDLPFSVSAWVKFDDLTDNGIIAKYSTAASVREWRFDFTATDKLELAIRDASSVEARVQSAALTSYEGQWIHVAATYDGAGPNSSNDFNAAADGIQLYLNGNSITGTAATFSGYAGMSDTSQDVWLGRYGGIYAEGEIRNVQLFNSALTAAQVEQVYRSGVPFELSQAAPGTLTTGWTNGGSGFDTFTDSGVDITSGVTDGSAAALCYSDTFTLTKGKRYRVSFDYTENSRSGSDWKIKTGSNSSLTSSGGLNELPTGDHEFVATDSGTHRIGFRAASGVSVDFSISGFRVEEIGAILDLNAASIDPTSASDNLVDASGNGFHGTLNSMDISNVVNLSSALSVNNPSPSANQSIIWAGNSGSEVFSVDEDGDVQLNGDVIITNSTTPASASATGTAGTIAWDASYIYICTAANTWKRVAISTW